ncbi:MAG: large subunit ribosomal protein L23 [Planctomycetota bacterium]|jgi:large subunit ribosomal protein L23
MTSIDDLYRIIKAPVITEKASDDTVKRNAYHFRVPLHANKIEIRSAIERIFEVKVTRVNTTRVRGKIRRRGWVAGARPDWKKAMVTLEEGATIDVI